MVYPISKRSEGCKCIPCNLQYGQEISPHTQLLEAKYFRKMLKINAETEATLTLI